MTVTMVPLFFNFLYVSGQASIDLEIIAVSLLLGVFLFVVILALVRVVTSWTSMSLVSRKNSVLPNIMTIAVDDACNVYLLPRNSAKIIHLQLHEEGAKIEVIDSLFSRDINPVRSFTVESGENGDITLFQPGALQSVRVTRDGEVVRTGELPSGAASNFRREYTAVQLHGKLK
jgi:hypothetical protein